MLTVVTAEMSDALATHLPHHSLTVDTVEALNAPTLVLRLPMWQGWRRSGQ